MVYAVYIKPCGTVTFERSDETKFIDMSVAAIVAKDQWDCVLMYMCEENYGQLNPNQRFPHFSGNVMLLISRENDEESNQSPTKISIKGVEAMMTTMDLYAEIFEDSAWNTVSRLQTVYDYFRDNVLPECTGWV